MLEVIIEEKYASGDADGDESTRTLRAEGVEGAWSMELSKRRYLRVRVKV